MDDHKERSEAFAVAFEARLRLTLANAARIGGAEAALLACLNAAINFALGCGLSADAVAELLRRQADDIEANRDHLGVPPATRMN